MSDSTSTRLLCSTPVLKSGDYVRSRAYSVDKPVYTLVEEGGDPPRFGRDEPAHHHRRCRNATHVAKVAAESRVILDRARPGGYDGS
jgi:hypothetical protein